MAAEVMAVAIAEADQTIPSSAATKRACEPAVRDAVPKPLSPTDAGPWDAPEYLTNDEALRILATRNSGIEPLLTRRGYRLAKRAFDVCASGAAIAGAILCAVICAKSPGASPIYSQWRIGRVNKDGSFHAFRMLKFRSMVPHADQMLAGLQEQNEASGPMFKTQEGIRRYGLRLRRSQLVHRRSDGRSGTNPVLIVRAGRLFAPAPASLGA